MFASFIGGPDNFAWLPVAIAILIALRISGLLNQKLLGVVLCGIGIVGVLNALNMTTSVDGYVNLGMMDERRNMIELFSVAVLAGIVLYGFGVLSGGRVGEKSSPNAPACPKCNGILEGTPELCKYCRTELRWNGGRPFTVDQSAELLPQWENARRIENDKRAVEREEARQREAGWRLFCRNIGAGLRACTLRILPSSNSAGKKTSEAKTPPLPFAETVPPQEDSST